MRSIPEAVHLTDQGTKDVAKEQFKAEKVVLCSLLVKGLECQVKEMRLQPGVGREL